MFVSYWVPSKVFLDLNREMSILKSKDIFSRTKEKNISDEVIEKENKLQVVFQDNANLLISIYGMEYILEFVTIHKIGFFIYKLPENYNEISSIIEIQAYHIFKDFFHSHEYHDEEEDGVICAKIIGGYFDEYCKSYLNQYVVKFENYLNDFQSATALKLRIDFNSEYKKNRFKKYIPKIDKELIRLYTIRKELSYFYFLLSNSGSLKKEYSFFHKDFRERLDFYINDYNILKEDIYAILSELTTNKQDKLAIYGLSLGLILGLWGIILSYDGIKIGKLGLTDSDFNIKYEELIRKHEKDFFKIQSDTNYLLSIDTKNFNDLQYIKNDCKK